MTFISLALDISSLCHVSLLWCQGHVTTYFSFPTMRDVSPLGWVMDVCIESFGDRKVFYDV